MQHISIQEKFAVSIFRPTFLFHSYVTDPLFEVFHSSYLNAGTKKGILLIQVGIPIFLVCFCIEFSLVLVSILLLPHNIFLFFRIQRECQLYRDTLLKLNQRIIDIISHRASKKERPIQNLQTLEDLSDKEVDKLTIELKDPLLATENLYAILYSSQKKAEKIQSQRLSRVIHVLTSPYTLIELPLFIFNWIFFKNEHLFDWISNKLFIEKIKISNYQTCTLLKQYEKTPSPKQ
jgi:hypothetical protein